MGTRLSPALEQLRETVADRLVSAADELGLTADQRAKIRQIHAGYAEKYQAQRDARRPLRREEFKALQPDSKMQRDDIVDEGLQALRLLFSERVASFDGKFYKFRDVELWPKPYQKKLPIYVGGNNANNIRRTVQWADGWLPAGMHVDRVRAGVKMLNEMAEQAGRDPKSIEVCPQFVVHVGKTHEAAVESFRKSQMNKHLVSLSKSTLKGQGTATHEDINLIGTPAEIVDKANAFREAGVTHLLGLYFAANAVPELLDQMQVFAEEVMPKIK